MQSCLTLEELLLLFPSPYGMKADAKARKSVLYCPNKGCVAYRENGNGIGAPLLEIPVDPNHVKIACPHCDLNLTQCGGCFGLMHSDVITTDSCPIATCVRCGFPNIVDENLRAVLSLPRTRPLPYHCVRVIQRAIHPEAYLKYKSLELSFVESLKSATGDDVEVISAAKLYSSSVPPHLSTEIESSSSDDQLASRLPNHKKRLRSDVMDAPESSKDPLYPHINQSDQEFHRPSKRVAELSDKGHIEYVPHSSMMKGSQQKEEWSINFGRWKSELQTPVASMIPFLRSQLKVLSVSRCIQQDSATWISMQYPQRAKRFLSIHNAILRTIANEWMKRSPKTSDNSLDLEHSPMKPKMDEEFFKLIDRFLTERSSLISVKSTHRTKVEPLYALLQPTSSCSIQNIGQRVGISEPILSSIVNIFKCHIQPKPTSIQPHGFDILALLETVGQEMRKVIFDLHHLLRSSPPANSQLQPLRTNSETSIAISTEIQASLLSEREPAVNPPKFDENVEFENIVEQRKLAILLLSNLHCSISAVIL